MEPSAEYVKLGRNSIFKFDLYSTWLWCADNLLYHHEIYVNFQYFFHFRKDVFLKSGEFGKWYSYRAIVYILSWSHKNANTTPLSGQWLGMGITSWTLRTLRTLEKCPSGNEKNIKKLHKLHGDIKSMLAHHNHMLYRSNLKIEFLPNLTYSTHGSIIVMKGLYI